MSSEKNAPVVKDEFDGMGFDDEDTSAEGAGTTDETPAAPPAEVKPKRGRKPKDPALKKLAEKPALTPIAKTVRKMLKKAKLAAAPELAQLIVGKVGPAIKIKDIGIFIGTPESESLKALAKECSVKNTVNLSAEVSLDQVMKVGVQILQNGRMFQPITVAKIGDALECTSGRHRLAFLGLVYGADSEIPVYAEEMDLATARDCVVVSNQSRKTKAMEQAEHAVLSAVGGNVDVEQDELYTKLVTSRIRASQYCVYSVLERKRPCKLSFLVSKAVSRKGDEMTTVKNLANFWKAALKWEKETERKAFDHSLKASIEFMNALVKSMKEIDGFDAEQHLASMTLSALGKYYIDFLNQRGDPMPVVDKIAKIVVGMGECGRAKAAKTYTAICKAMQK
jgi:hypothetical protein